MVIRRHKECFQPLYINTYSIRGRGRGIFDIFQYFRDFFKLKIHENQETSVLLRILVYFVTSWLGMLDNGEFFDIEAIVPHILVILPSKMAENGSKLTKKRAFFKKGMQSHPKRHLILPKIIWWYGTGTSFTETVGT